MNKGLWRIPRHLEAMKGVATDETLRRAGSKHRPEDTRMRKLYILPIESIDRKERT
jgi:hypothetical protein